MSADVPDRAEWFLEGEGYPQPDWDAIDNWIAANVAEPDAQEAWQQCTRHWLARLATHLGGSYRTDESRQFHLLSDLPTTVAREKLDFLEDTRARISRVLGDTVLPLTCGKHVVLRFSDPDDYYRYISHFYPDGEFAGTSGMFLSRGYMHVAYTEAPGGDQERPVLVHELAHNLVAHLPLPPWLNEALAMAFENDIAGSFLPPLTRDLAQRHREHWSAATIQEFWTGAAFSGVEEQELAYSLARVLLDLIYVELRPTPEEFRKFVHSADWRDAGAAATEEHLDIAIEDLVSAFLGPGEWAPQPTSWTALGDQTEQPASCCSGDIQLIVTFPLAVLL